MTAKKLTGLAAAVALTFGVGAAHADTITIQMTSTWTSGITLIESDRRFVENVNRLAGDRLRIRFHEGGTLVPSMQVFDAVSAGDIDASGDWPGYWAGRNSAFSLLGSYPMLLSTGDYLFWIQQWGGFDAYQEVYGQYDMVYLPYALITAESGLRSRQRMPDLASLDGKRIRMSGRPQGAILERLGAAQVNLPGQDVYQALERGVVDAAEFSDPGIDYMLGFHEVTDYWTAPGWHQPGNVGGVMINRKVWDSLDEDLQHILKVAAEANLAWSVSYFNRHAAEATAKFREAGIEVDVISDDELDQIQEIANEVLVRDSCENPLFAKIALSQLQFMQDYADWRDLQSTFAFGRNLKSFPDMDRIRECAEQG